MSGTATDASAPAAEPGLRATTHYPLTADVVVRDLSWTPSAVHQAMFARDSSLGDELVATVRDLLAGHSPQEARQTLRDLDVTALSTDDGTTSLYRDHVIDAVAGTDYGAANLIWMTRQLGTGHDHYGTSSPLDDLQHGDLPLLEAADSTPTVAVRLDADFRETPRQQRVRVLTLLADYGDALDVVLFGSGLTLRWLRREHSDILPTSVTDAVTTPQDSGPLADVVAAARDSLDPDGRAATMLRDIANDPAETLTYSALASMHSVSDSYPRKIAATLEDLGLAERVKIRGRGAVSLLAAGRAYLDAVDADADIAPPSESSVTPTRKAPSNSRENPTGQEGGHPAEDDRPDRDRPARYPVRDLSWAEAATFTAASETGEFGLLNAPTAEDWENPNQPGMHYDGDRDRLVVAAQAQNPMQYWVGIARALTDGRIFQDVITPERLAGGTDDGELAALANGSRYVQRVCRNLGYLKNEYDAEDYVDRLQEEHEKLLDATQRLAQEDYSEGDRNALRGNILSRALGLACTMGQICDLLDIDLVRGAWLPDMDNVQDVDALARTWAMGASIDARYGHYVVYRQLYEPREDKRQSSGSPQVDHSDPVGELTGSFAVVGDVGRVRDGDDGEDVLLEDLVEDALENPKDLHDDAPEIAVNIPLRTANSRSRYAQVAREILSRKHISATREAVSFLEAFARSPKAAAEALAYGLSSEDDLRDVHLDEVRRALATLDPHGLLEGVTPTVRDVVSVLLGTDAPLSQTALADRAGRVPRSVANNAEILLDLGLVEETPEGWRLRFPTSDERGSSQTLPWFLDEADHRVIGDVQLHQVLQEIVDSRVDLSSERWLDLQSLLWFDADGPPDIDAFVDECPWIAPWLPVLTALLPGIAASEPDSPTVTMGSISKQTPLAAFAD